MSCVVDNLSQCIKFTFPEKCKVVLCVESKMLKNLHALMTCFCVTGAMRAGWWVGLFAIDLPTSFMHHGYIWMAGRRLMADFERATLQKCRYVVITRAE